MGYRLSRITTKTGDDGSTGLADGSRVSKSDPRIECIGEIDELNSAVGFLLSYPAVDAHRELLSGIQHDLFDIGGGLSLPGHPSVSAERIADLEATLEMLNGTLKPLREFILPGGTAAAGACHLARAVCRRAERRLVTLASTQPVPGEALRYLNRLSDLLFVLARTLNREGGVNDVFWEKRTKH